MITTTSRRLAALSCAALLVLGACGGDDDDDAVASADDTEAEGDAPTEGGASTGSGEGGDEPTSDGTDDTGDTSDDVSDETGPAGDDGDDGEATDDTGETGGAGSTGSEGSTTTAAGGGSSPFTLEAGEKPIPDTSLVFLRPVPGAVYTYSDSTGGTITYTVEGATENAGGLDVDVALSASFPAGDVEIGYLFRYLADGSIEVPFTDFSSLGGEGGLTFVQQPNFQLLDRAAVDSGSEFAGSTTAIIEVAGQQITAEYAFVGRGLPQETVTVPAGTFTAIPIQFDVEITISGPASTTASLQSTFYLNEEIGLVRSTYSSDLAGAGSTDLVSCSLL
jgi:hypothetical protein